MAFDKRQFRALITAVLKEAGMYSDSAVELLMLTAAVESQLGTYLTQINGPARGVFQMEPATEKDLWRNYLEYQEATAKTVSRYDSAGADDLYWNLGYQIILARVHYLRVSEALPPADDVVALAKYWKKYYNTHLGKGDIDKAIEAYTRYC